VVGDPDRPNSYSDQMRLDALLDLQHSFSGDDAAFLHDEMLFVVIHQTGELWFKLLLHETRLARRRIARDEVLQSFKTLSRLRRIVDQLTHAWDVLATMTPVDFLSFRARLGTASGLQSYQYREFEFLLGAKDPRTLASLGHEPAAVTHLKAVMAEPSLYDEVIRLLARRGLPVPENQINRDFSKPREPDPGIVAAWLALYRNVDAHPDLYELAEKLIDLDQGIAIWRHNHATTVERVIGNKTGTGGTAGVDYLRRAVFNRFFPELWECRAEL
jgi:tryptophan 2,3-dioxygenase